VGEPYWTSGDGDVTVYLGKCEDVLPGLPAASVDAIVTDPPAAVKFMGREWDSDLGGRDKWVAWLAGCMTQAARVLKPGGHLLVWSLPRTSGWTQWALEDAGLEIRDCIVHLFGQGFPKSLNVERAIAVVTCILPGRHFANSLPEEGKRLADDHVCPVTPESAPWDRFGTAAKPGQEMWWLARKPLAAGSVAGNVLAYGTGALNIASCRVGTETMRESRMSQSAGGVLNMNGRDVEHGNWQQKPNDDPAEHIGRWPTNIVFSHDARCEPAGTRRVKGSSRADRADRTNGIPSVSLQGGVDGSLNRVQSPGYADADGLETVQAWSCVPGCPVGELDRQSGVTISSSRPRHNTAEAHNRTSSMGRSSADWITGGHDDTGGASRFFPVFRYQAKAKASERPRLEDGTGHETVKPLELIRWLCRLVTPPGGTVLDLFAGSGPVGEACIIEGFRCVLIDEDPKSARLIRKRLGKPIQPVMFGLEA
jgi:hypothetical protein